LNVENSKIAKDSHQMLSNEHVRATKRQKQRCPAPCKELYFFTVNRLKTYKNKIHFSLSVNILSFFLDMNPA